jgi:cell division protein FtsW
VAGFKESQKKFVFPDLAFLSVVLFLAGLGLVMVYSASSVVALEKFGDSAHFLKRQLNFFAAGLVAMIFLMESDYRIWVQKGAWVFAICVAALICLFIPGVGARVGGALRWISIGGFRLQPSEFAKLGCVLYLAGALVRKGHNVRTFTYGLLPMLLVAGGVAALLMQQPDFGNAVLLVTLTALMVFLAGGRLTYLLGVALASLPVIWFGIHGQLYRQKRLLSFLNPWNDPQGTSYQIIQSFSAFFSGGFWGRGLGNSQEKLYYLPEVHTDFIGSVVGEELGFIGIFLLIGAFGFLVWRGFRIALRAYDPSGFLLAAGCTILLGLQALLNLMVITGLLPTKGLPLPFLSHGGSALVVSFCACGLILSVGKRAHLEGPEPSSPWLKRWG